MHEQDDIHQHQMIQKQLNDRLLQDVSESLQSIVQRANEAIQEVLNHGLTRMDQLIKTVDKGELKKAEKDNSADLADLRSQSCFRKVTVVFTHLAQVSKIFAEQDVEENASKRYLLEKLVKISDHKMGEGKKFLDFGSDGIYAKCSKEDKAVNSPLSTKIANTLDSVSSLANSIHHAYEYPFILDKMKKLCEGIEEQKLNPEDELSSIVNALKAEAPKPESLAERMRDKILLENIPFTLETISTVAEKTMQEVLDYGIGADELAKSAKTLTLELNKISKVAKVMDRYGQVEGEAGDKKFLLEKEISKQVQEKEKIIEEEKQKIPEQNGLIAKTTAEVMEILDSQNGRPVSEEDSEEAIEELVTLLEKTVPEAQESLSYIAKKAQEIRHSLPGPPHIKSYQRVWCII